MDKTGGGVKFFSDENTLFHGGIITWKHINEDTQEMLQPQSTAYPRYQKKGDEKQIRAKQKSHFKPQSHKEDLQERKRLEKPFGKLVGSLNQF